MATRARLDSVWTDEERAILSSLDSPERIQEYLDNTPYSTDHFYRCPRSVMRDRRAHCFDGAVFAAAAFERLGDEPLLLDMRSVRDDDHVITLFRRRNHFGAVAKSNVVLLRYREPIYRSLRELVMSFFDLYYNVQGEKSLRSYSLPVNLGQFSRRDWKTRDETMESIANKLDDRRHIPVLTPAMIRALAPVDKRLYDAGLMGANVDGLYGYQKPA